MVNSKSKKPTQIQYTGVDSTGTKLTVSEEQRNAIKSSSRILGGATASKKRFSTLNNK